MDMFWSVALVVSVLLAVLLALSWLAARVRRRGIGGDVMAQVDQVFRPTAHQSHHEIQAQAERGVTMTSPDEDHRRP
jgi:hypothetical protein